MILKPHQILVFEMTARVGISKLMVIEKPILVNMLEHQRLMLPEKQELEVSILMAQYLGI